MKKVVILMAVAFAFLATACSHQQNKKILAKEVVYDVMINNDKMMCDAENDGDICKWYLNNIQASERFTFLDHLFEKAKNGKLVMKDNDGNVMTSDQFKEKLIVFDSARRSYLSPKYDTLIRSAIESYHIVSLRFREKWMYDTRTMEITKNVISYAPLYFPNDPRRPGKRVRNPLPLFWLEQDTLADCKIQLTHKIEYSLPINCPPFVANPDSANCAQYMERLTHLVFTDSITAYLFQFGKKDSVVAGKDWKAMFGMKSNDKETQKIAKCFDPADCMRFMEEWYINPVSMEISKKVTGLSALTQVFTRRRGEFIGYKQSYLVKFNVTATTPVKKKNAEETPAKKKK